MFINYFFFLTITPFVKMDFTIQVNTPRLRKNLQKIIQLFGNNIISFTMPKI